MKCDIHIINHQDATFAAGGPISGFSQELVGELGLILGMLGFIITLSAILISARSIYRQLWLQGFLAFTQRYNDIIAEFPEKIRGSEYLETKLSDISTNGKKEEFLISLRKYYNLLSEEYHIMENLKFNKKLDAKTWKVWVAELKRLMKCPAVGEGWQKIKKEYDDDFAAMVDQYLPPATPSVEE